MEKKKILVIEDDAVLSSALRDFLTYEGFEVSIAVDGEEGTNMAEKIRPNLILLDIIMPKKDGYQVIRELKADSELRNIPVILLTNLGSINDVEKALELGATTYLVKADYKLEEITEKIKSILDKK